MSESTTKTKGNGVPSPSPSPIATTTTEVAKKPGALHYAVDLSSALVASFAVSPFITIVDRSIIQNASGVMKMGDSVKAGFLELGTKPHVFCRRPEFLMIWGVYAATYVTANTINTTCEVLDAPSAWPRFLGTSVVNMYTCIRKDRNFTRLFGKGQPKPVPTPTYLLFVVRDSMTIGASFNAPQVMSAYMQDKGWSESNANFTAQMVCPAAVQFLSTPLHLYGLDLYNNPSNDFPSRLSFIKAEYLKSVGGRIGRIGPAFGIGGVGNKFFRDMGRSWLQD